PAGAHAARPAGAAPGRTPPGRRRCRFRSMPAAWPSDSRLLTTVIGEDAGGQRLGVQGDLATPQGLLDFLDAGQVHLRQGVEAFLQRLQAQLRLARLLAVALADGRLGAHGGGLHRAELYRLE